MNHHLNKDLYHQILYDLLHLSSKRFDNLSKKLLEYIRLAKRVSSFEWGFISYAEGEQFIILQTDHISYTSEQLASIQLCDTLCQEIIQQQHTLVYGRLKETKFYKLPLQTILNIEAVIGTPIFIDDRIVGTLTICATSEKEDPNQLDFYAHILELIAAQLSHLLQESQILEKLEDDRLLLKMGADLLKMGTYKRYPQTGHVECTDSVYTIFDVPREEKLSFHRILPKVVEADKTLVINNFKRYNPQDIPHLEYRIMTHTGTVRWIRHQIKYNPTKGYVLGIVQDVTVLKTSLLELGRQNQELEQFAYATAHDLQEPLRTIRGFSDLLLQSHQDQLNNEGRLYLSFLKDSSERMQQQIEGLLHHSRIGRTGQKVTIDLDQLVRATIDDFRFSILQQEAQVVLLQPLPSIMGYPTEIRMLFQNLISNALKFSAPHRKSLVQISYSDEKTHYAFQIQDNGIGMEAHQLDKIFSLFVRLHAREKYAGTGIGLTHCKKIVELHCGEITVTSKLDVGTTFIFTLEKI